MNRSPMPSSFASAPSKPRAPRRPAVVRVDVLGAERVERLRFAARLAGANAG
jgi:hypothetical protein